MTDRKPRKDQCEATTMVAIYRTSSPLTDPPDEVVTERCKRRHHVHGYHESIEGTEW